MQSSRDIDLLEAIPLDADRIFEIGDGNLGDAFRTRQPASMWTNLERDAPFDAIVLPHGFDGVDAPLDRLATLKGMAAPGAALVVRLRNPSHWSHLGPSAARHDLLAGEEAIRLFGQAGWTLIEARPKLGPEGPTDTALAALSPLADRLGVDMRRLRNNVAPEGWIFRAVNGPAPSQLHLVGLGLAGVAGVTKARIDYPLAALASLTRVRAVWGAGGVATPPQFDPGILIVQRQRMSEPSLAAKVTKLIERGWVIIHELDDDPSHWPGYVDDGYYDLRSVHAVTVSTDRLAAKLRRLNPNLAVFPNAIPELPAVPPATPKQGDRLRIFFGALNRWNDWSAISGSLLETSARLGDQIEYVVVHDDQVFDSIPKEISKQFYPTLSPDHYMALLASCDIALLPLLDNEFRRCKSDLKFIECCAAGAVPICSPVVYADRPEHHDIGVFAETPADWARALAALCADPAEIISRRMRGLAYVRAKRMQSQQIAARESWYRGLLADRDRLEAERRSRL